MNLAHRIAPALPLAGLLLASAAQAETKASAVATLEGGYGSNPLLNSLAGSQTSGSLLGRIQPTVIIEGPTTQLNLNGRVEHIVFTDGYKDMTNWSIGSSLGVDVNARSKFSLTAGYASQVQSAVSSSLPIPGEDPAVDPATGELGGQRIKSLNGTATFTSQLSARDEISVSTFASDVTYGSAAYTGYDHKSYGGSVGLSHAMNARTSIGGSVSYAQSSYDSAAFGEFRQITPSVNASIKLSPHLLLTAGAGLSFSRTSVGGTTTNQTYFSGQASLCNKGARSDMCLNLSRSLGSTAGSGNSTITLISATYSYQLTPRSSFTLSGSYSESKSIKAVGGVDYGYGVLAANYQRQLGKRLSFSVQARYTEPFKSITGRRKGFYGGAGINYRLGR